MSRSPEAGMVKFLEEVVTGSGIVCIDGLNCSDCCAALKKVIQIEQSLQQDGTDTSSEPDIIGPRNDPPEEATL